MRSRISDALAWPRGIGPVLTLVDPLAVVLAGLLVLQDPAPAALALAALAAVLVCRAADLHRSRLVLSVLEDLPHLLLAALTVTLVLGGLSSSVDLRAETLAAVAFGTVSFAGMVLLRTAVYALTHVLRRSGAITHPVVIVGSGVIGRRIAESLLLRREYGLVPVGMVDSGARPSSHGPALPLLGGIGDLDRAMSDLGVDDVIFAFPGLPDQETIEVARQCVQRDRQVFVVPRFFELMGSDRHRRTEMVRDIAVMRLQRRGTRWYTRLTLRASDVAVSLGGLLVLSPVLLAIAVAVRMETGPGVLFHQTRVGEGGRTFTLLKFQCLRPVAFGTDATTWSFDNDSRIGPVGQFLRRTGLDELPQLVNVLRGEMSLVGPRPERRPVRVEASSRGRDAVVGSPGSFPHDPWVRLDDLSSEHWSWREDLLIALRALRGKVSRPTT